MGDIAQRGNRLTFAKGGRAGFQDGKKVQRRGKHIPGKWNPERKTEDRPKYVTIPSRLDSQRKNIRLKAEHASGLKKGGKADKN